MAESRHLDERQLIAALLRRVLRSMTNNSTWLKYDAELETEARRVPPPNRREVVRSFIIRAMKSLRGPDRARVIHALIYQAQLNYNVTWRWHDIRVIHRAASGMVGGFQAELFSRAHGWDNIFED